MGDGPMRLNVGCGPIRPVGWVNVEPYPGVDRDGIVVADPVVDGLPFTDGTFDGAVAHHVLQMLPYPLLVPWLREVRRVMKPGAVLRVTVPDIVSACYALDDHDADWFPIDDSIAESVDAKFCLYVSQAGATRSVFTEGWICEVLDAAGFVDPSPFSTWAYVSSVPTRGPGWLADLDSRIDESLFAEAEA